MSIYTNAATDTCDEAQAYVRAVLDLVGTEDPMAILRSTPRLLEGLVTSLDAERLAAPEAPGKWSIVEVLQHLADAELVWGYRLRKALAEERPALEGYDQDLWADRLRYAEVDPRRAVGDFRTLRAANLRLLLRSPEEDLDRGSVHAERGEESVRHMIRLYAGHDLVHRNQIERILAQQGS